jgi:hypothetical protein
LPETVLVHAAEATFGIAALEIGIAALEISFQPAIFMFASAPATTVTAEPWLLNW